MDQGFINLIIGFLCTSVLGGILGTALQQRSWDHQNETRLRAEEFQQAKKVCKSVSQLLDKRRYRMLRLYYAISGFGEGTFALEVLQQRLRDYDTVLFEWNDRLNMNLALVGTYFGEDARRFLDETIYESFKALGARLEEAYREVQQGSTSEQSSMTAHMDDLYNQLDQINDYVYRLGLFMMVQLRDGKVGQSAPGQLRRMPLEKEL